MGVGAEGQQIGVEMWKGTRNAVYVRVTGVEMMKAALMLLHNHH